MSNYDNLKSEITQLIANLNDAKTELEAKFEDFQSQQDRIAEMKGELKLIAREKSKGCPALANAYEEYFELQDKNLVDFLKYKNVPALQASQVVSEYSKLKRAAEKEARIYKGINDYYLSIAPYLSEVEEELPEDDDEYVYEEYSEEESQDMTTRFLTKEEYRSLSSSERNQLALDRYWSKRKKSKWLIGKMYERFVGFLYEKTGHEVEYFGIKERYEDLGRDLIAKKGKVINIVQCKNWSKYKKIFENHIFQLFGTTFEYNQRNKTKAKAVFITTTKLSDVAKDMCDKLGISVMQEFPLKVYPSIKCNISKRTGEKIYHLPFDQQYDNTNIEQEKLEKYVTTVKEAEGLGFRRAFRWHGNK